MKILYITLLILTSFIAKGQINRELLLQLHEGSSSDIQAIASPNKGQVIYDSDLNVIRYFDGTTWVLFGQCNYTAVINKTSDYTLNTFDSGKIFTMDSSSGLTLTIPSGLPKGFNVSVYQIGTGQVSIVGSSVTIKHRLSRFKTAGQDAGISIVSTTNNVFHLTGDLSN